MIFIINLTRGQMRFLTCVARVTCLVIYNYTRIKYIIYNLYLYNIILHELYIIYYIIYINIQVNTINGH